MIKFKVFFIMMVLGGCAISTEHSEEIINRLKVEEKTYYDHLIATKKYEKLLDRIENGDEVLIRGSYLLSQWTDASTSLALKYSLSRAVTKKPDTVMSLIPGYFSVSDICTIPYIEGSIDTELAHINDSLSALGSSPKENTSMVYAQCIKIYKKFKKSITKNSREN